MPKDLSRILQLLNKSWMGWSKGFNLEKAETAAKSAWAADTVDPNGYTFAKMSLSPPTTAALPTAPAPDNVVATTATAATANKNDVGDGGFGRKRRFSDVENWPQTRRRQDRSIERMG
jgi:hypothetical protein